jgi:cysteine desulfurase
VSEAPVYLDSAATTPVDPRVIEAMTACLCRDGEFANAASSHAAGQRARVLIERARAQVAARIGAQPGEIIFTSGATEANNLALKGVFAARGSGAGLVTTRIEHASVIDVARSLEMRGVAVAWVSCDTLGRVDPAAIAALIDDNTALVSVMHVNNETGVIQDIEAIAACCRDRGVLLHVDAAQSIGKLPFDVARLGADLVSLTAHKLHGPKGAGALYVRPGVTLEPLLHGGEHERGLRAGTQATHQIVGMGLAYQLADPARDGPAIAALRDALWEGIRQLEGIRMNGDPRRRAPHLLNVSFPGVEGESLRLALEDIAVSAGSACASDSADASHVLSGMGLGDALAASSLRFSVSRMTRPEEIGRAVERVGQAVSRLRGLAGTGLPRWCST